MGGETAHECSDCGGLECSVPEGGKAFSEGDI